MLARITTRIRKHRARIRQERALLTYTHNCAVAEGLDK